jgi:hypothetical protein
MKERTARTTLLVLIGLFFGAFAVSACDFAFNYDEITAPVGTVGEIGVRVQKTHNNCTMTDQFDYQFAWENLQILGETPWEEVGPQLYEKWFKVSLSAAGEGFLKISKTCSKEGYEEAILPVTITPGEEDGVWSVAMSGVYPFTDETGMTAEMATGVIWLHDSVLSIADRSVILPTVPEGLVDYQGEVYVYTSQAEEESAHLIDTEDEDYELPMDGAGYGYGLGLPGGAREGYEPPMDGTGYGAGLGLQGGAGRDGVPSDAVMQESHEADLLEPVEEHEEGDGFGRLTVEEICVQHGISVADGLIHLQNYGLEADSTTRIRVLRDLYAASGYDSTDLVHIIQGLEPGEHEHEHEDEGG